MIVAGFTARTDLNKAAEIANEVRRVIKDLKDCHAQVILYNQRERLFNQPVMQVGLFSESVDAKFQKHSTCTREQVLTFSSFK